MIKKFFILFALMAGPLSMSFGQTEREISVEFFDKDLREALKEISDKAAVSIVCTEELQMKVSGKFVNVPWPVVLRSLLDAGGYGYEVDRSHDRVIIIKRREEILETAVIRVENAPVLDVRRTVEEFLSPNGKVQDDARSNSIIVTDHPQYIKKITEIVTKVDMEIPQVMIEALIVEVNVQDAKSVGINWQSLAGYEIGVTPSASFTRNRTKFDRNATHHIGDSSRAPAVRRTQDRPRSANIDFQTFDTLSPDNPVSTSTHVETTGPRTRDVFFPEKDDNRLFAFDDVETLARQRFYSAILDGDTFRMVLSALEQTGDLDVLSNPHIVTTENREAEILVGERFPIADFVFNPETATLEVKGFEYIDIGISLRVTPRVVGGNEILMDVQPEVSQEGAPIVFGGASGTFIPRIITQEAKTKVVVRDGSTLVIGGLIREAEVKSGTRVPVLGHIPLLGNLFRSRGTEKVKRNLMIFITPRILTRENMPAITSEKMNMVRPPKVETKEEPKKKGWWRRGEKRK